MSNVLPQALSVQWVSLGQKLLTSIAVFHR